MYVQLKSKYWFEIYNKHVKQLVPTFLIQNFEVSKIDEVRFGQKLRYAIPPEKFNSDAQP